MILIGVKRLVIAKLLKSLCVPNGKVLLRRHDAFFSSILLFLLSEKYILMWFFAARTKAEAEVKNLREQVASLEGRVRTLEEANRRGYEV